MARKNEAHDIVMESLTEALLRLMEKKPLADINVSELCGLAGVSRVSFYRNFKTMQDILVQHLTKCTDDWWIEFSKRPDDELYRTFWVELFEQYKKNKRLIMLLMKNNASGVLKEHIFACCGPSLATDENDAYARAVLAGAVYGLVEVWIERGMKEFPEGFNIYKLASILPR